MKRIFLLMFVAIAALSFSRCDEDDDTKSKSDSTIEGTVKNNEVYTHDFGTMGIEDGATLTKSPQHAKAFSLQRNNVGHLVFTYEADGSFKGKDEAEIEFCYSIGSAACYKKETVEIDILVGK
ncbi:hypothetical protein [Chryseolinea lacunae]|uniref:Lipoprotein n=1 Tax=Chryseolinea lacunae TaxID=2801331 RepID=A0ABS1KW17_9BACT|nr:hypothetical protein [Chryseolinea lacunae]MBL0743513.1 hypothetical protein [Chryseolinea lacunae]